MIEQLIFMTTGILIIFLFIFLLSSTLHNRNRCASCTAHCRNRRKIR